MLFIQGFRCWLRLLPWRDLSEIHGEHSSGSIERSLVVGLGSLMEAVTFTVRFSPTSHPIHRSRGRVGLRIMTSYLGISATSCCSEGRTATCVAFVFLCSSRALISRKPNTRRDRERDTGYWQKRGVPRRSGGFETGKG